MSGSTRIYAQHVKILIAITLKRTSLWRLLGRCIAAQLGFAYQAPEKMDFWRRKNWIFLFENRICGFYKYDLWIFSYFLWISWVAVARRSFWYMTLGPISSWSCVFVSIWVYLGVFVDFTNTICGFVCDFLWIYWVGVARRSFWYMTLGLISSRSCVFVGFGVYLGVFVDFTNTISGFVVNFFVFPGSG